MNRIHAFALTLIAGLPLAAQVPGCPYERAKTVQPTWVMGPAVPCASGVNMQIGGLTVKTSGNICPLFVVITPTHEESERNDRPTRVQQIGQAAEQTAFFRCVPDYFLFFNIGSSCVFQHIQVSGAVNRLVTAGCEEPKVTN